MFRDERPKDAKDGAIDGDVWSVRDGVRPASCCERSDDGDCGNPVGMPGKVGKLGMLGMLGMVGITGIVGELGSAEGSDC